MRNYHAMFIGALLFLAACTKSKNNSNNIITNRFVELAYDTSYLYPAGFYNGGLAYYENTVSIMPLAERKENWIELSTDDKTQALEWSDNSDKFSSVHRPIVAETETEKYFEFKRQSTTNSDDIVLSRVHKTKYFHPLLDRLKRADTIGVFNQVPTVDNVKEFIEYLWSCGSLAMYDFKVLESNITESNTRYSHYIKSIQLTHGDFGMKDSIYVYDNYFELDKNSHILTFTFKLAEVLEGY